ncbi:07ad2d1b-d3fe-4896-94f7-e0f42a14c7b5 [Sclerotinia trifoliorum]|uniref:07ad2d1b-d3fe-4896-94f7-e0f42a14c7b5 n=1 Tax=Sclerotinia trifoliorum TaxID=28548 RepID=A0A8H2ZQ61_9HELO|nr:07ad2d1b-d3fe-4896-94f7-e0f42a14c7b5 [Sclerotinia trifoliorum]
MHQKTHLKSGGLQDNSSPQAKLYYLINTNRRPLSTLVSGTVAGQPDGSEKFMSLVVASFRANGKALKVLPLSVLPHDFIPTTSALWYRPESRSSSGNVQKKKPVP